MAIKLPDGRIMRTLPEQVDKNMQDIELLMNKGLLSAEVVDELPETGEPNVIYFVPSDDPSEQNVYDEYMWRDDAWEMVGKSTIDLSNYVTLDSEQEITALKTFDVGISFNNENATGLWGIKQDGANQLSIYQDSAQTYCFQGGQLFSLTNADLGNNNRNWKDLYLNGKVYFKGTNYTGYITNDNNRMQIYYANTLRFEVGNADATFYTGVVRPYQSNTVDLGASSNKWNNLYLSGTIYLGNSASISSDSSGIFPDGNGSRNLGINARKWKDLYLSGNITDGTVSVAVADIIRKRLTVQYSVSAAASSGISMINLTLSADDLAKLDSTKPLIIANNSTSAAVISAVYLPALNLFTVLAYQTQGNTSLNFDIYQ